MLMVTKCLHSLPLYKLADTVFSAINRLGENNGI